MDWQNVIFAPLSLAGGILLLLIVLAAFLWATGKIEGYDPVNEMMFRDNSALGVRYALFTIAVIFTLLGIFSRAQGDSGIVDFIEHAALSIGLLYVSRLVNEWFILYHFSNNREVVQEKNLAVALVEGATYLASAYVIAGAFLDWENGMWLAALWFAIGQLLLIALAFVYRMVARGTDEQLDHQNIAVGLSLGGFLLSGGIVCGAVITGPSRGWQQDLTVVATYLVVWLFLVLLAHWLSERITYRSSQLRDEVMQQRNIAAALFKAVLFIAVTLGYTHG